MEALYRPKKCKGRPSDLTHEKTTQKSWKYNSDSLHVSETEVTKTKGNLLGLVRPLQKDICSPYEIFWKKNQVLGILPRPNKL